MSKKLKVGEIGEIVDTAYLDRYFSKSNFSDFDVSRLNVNTNGDFDSTYLRKALNNNNKVFRLTELYNQHKDMVIEMIQTARIYNDEYIDQLFQTYGGQLFRSREDVLRTVTRNYHLLDQMPNRPFSKLTKDIFEELGLTYIQS